MRVFNFGSQLKGCYGKDEIIRAIVNIPIKRRTVGEQFYCRPFVLTQLTFPVNLTNLGSLFNHASGVPASFSSGVA